MSAQKTPTNIITLFDELTDNLSELGSDAKLRLFNRKYDKFKSTRGWEVMRKTASVTIASSAIAIPSDFSSWVENEYGEGQPYTHGFYVDDNFYPVVRMSERKKFSDYSYYDPVANTITIPSTLSVTGTASFDYYHEDGDLIAGGTILTPIGKQDVIAYDMAVEHYNIDQTEQGRSKSGQYQEVVADYYEDLEYDDNRLKEVTTPYAS